MSTAISKKTTPKHSTTDLSSFRSSSEDDREYLTISVVTSSEEQEGKWNDSNQVYKWSVSFKSFDDAFPLENYIEKIILQLHESFEVPKRILKEPPYTIKEEGWGEFNIGATIYFKDQQLLPLKFTHPLSFESNSMTRDIKTSCKLSTPSMNIGSIDGATIELLANRLCQISDDQIKKVVSRVQESKNSKTAIVTHQEPTKGTKEVQDGVFTFDLYALEENDLLDLCDLVGLSK